VESAILQALKIWNKKCKDKYCVLACYKIDSLHLFMYKHRLSTFFKNVQLNH
jgi:hypothetical protein